MAQCDLCGKETELVQAEIEGTEMSVCRACAQHGTIKDPAIPKKAKSIKKSLHKKPAHEPALETVESIVPDYGQKIRKAREKLGLNQEDFAKKINEKESLLHKMETGSFEPSLPSAKKLEKILGIKLIERVEEKETASQKTSSEGFTIGDLIRKK